MEHTIYYFSATGNSLHMAKQIAKRIEADIKPMATHMGRPCDSKIIGIVFPVFFWGVPRTVERFLKGLQVKHSNPYIFAVATYGGMAGGALGYVKKFLQECGLELSYGEVVPMVANYIEEYDLRKESLQMKCNQADRKAGEIAECIRKREKNKINNVHIWERGFHKLYLDLKLNKDEGFHVDTGCNGCGVCAKICPNQNIKIESGKPIFQHHCEHCVACIQWCPSQALQWKGVTVKRSRYHHPEIALKEMM